MRKGYQRWTRIIVQAVRLKGDATLQITALAGSFEILSAAKPG